MKTADRMGSHRGSITVTEMQTFLEGSKYHGFKRWLFENRGRWRIYDQDGSGAIEKAELGQAVEDFLEAKIPEEVRQAHADRQAEAKRMLRGPEPPQQLRSQEEDAAEKQEGGGLAGLAAMMESHPQLNVGGVVVTRHQKAAQDMIDMCLLSIKSSKLGSSGEAVEGVLGKLKQTLDGHYQAHRQMVTAALQQAQSHPNEVMKEENSVLKVSVEHLEGLLAHERAKTRHLEAVVAVGQAA